MNPPTVVARGIRLTHHGMLAIAFVVLYVEASLCSVASETSAAQPNNNRLRNAQEATARVQLRGPEPNSATHTGLLMSIQIGENRFYRLDTLSARTLDLGQIELGWSTYRVYDVTMIALGAKGKHVPLNKMRLSCSGGFEVKADRALQLVIEKKGHDTTCSLR